MPRITGKKMTFVIGESRRLPNGVRTTVDRIEHPGATLIVPLLSARRMVFLWQYRAVLDRRIYELPAGTLDAGETPLRCARRELVEEAGFGARVWRRLGRIFPVPGYSNEVIHIYQAEQLFARQAAADVDEIMDRRILSRSEVRALFRQGKIQDAKTISALCLCGWL